MAIIKKHRVQPKLMGNKHVRDRRIPKMDSVVETDKIIYNPIRKKSVAIKKNEEPIAVLDQIEESQFVEEPVIEETPKKKRQSKKKAEEIENNIENVEENV